MKEPVRIKKTGLLPHAIIENIIDNHPAVDPDTGHLICHYKLIGLALVEVMGENYPALTVGDCIVVVNDPRGVESLKKASDPLETSTLPPSEPGITEFPIYEIAGVMSMLRDSKRIEVRRLKSGGDYLVFIVEGEYEAAIIVEKCKRPSDTSAILQV